MNGFGLFRFNALADPWALLLIVPVVLLLAAEMVAHPPGALAISTGETLARLRTHGRVVWRWTPAVLRAIGLSLLVMALARPLKGTELRQDRENVVDIILCVDVSGSMKAMDFESAGQRQNRLAVTKEAVRDFIESRKGRPGDRYGLDRLGLVLYAGYAWTQCPLTLDYGVLDRELDLARIDERDPRKRGTAIGSAIGLAVNRLRKSEAKSKVIILLTDGLNNAGELDPNTAARMAKEYGIRIYTIGAGSGEEVYVPTTDFFGRETMAPVQMPMDEEALRKIAEITNAKYYRAKDTGSLITAYEEINQLETTEVELGDYYEHEEGFVPFAVAGTGLLLASIFGRRYWFEAIP